MAHVASNEEVAENPLAGLDAYHHRHLLHHLVNADLDDELPARISTGVAPMLIGGAARTVASTTRRTVTTNAGLDKNQFSMSFFPKRTEKKLLTCEWQLFVIGRITVDQ